MIRLGNGCRPSSCPSRRTGALADIAVTWNQQERPLGGVQIMENKASACSSKLMADDAADEVMAAVWKRMLQNSVQTANNPCQAWSRYGTSSRQ